VFVPKLKGRKRISLRNGILLKNIQVKERVLEDGKWIMDPKCMHVKNEISYVQFSTTIIL
jgi:hypothetical protein